MDSGRKTERTTRTFVTVLMAIVLLAASARSVRSDDTASLRVAVSIFPQKYFVEKICGGRADVLILVRPGDSPETYNPTPQQMAALSGADVYFCIGVPFEETLKKKIQSISGSLKIIDAQMNIPLRKFDSQSDDHDQGASDPHFWLDPMLASQMASFMGDTLAALYPEYAAYFRDKTAALETELSGLNATLSTMLEPYRGRRIYVSHAAFGYFCAAYGLQQVAIESGGKEAGPKRLSRIIDMARRDHISTVFEQKEFSHKGADVLAAEIRAEVIELDPLAGSYAVNLLDMAHKIAKSFSKGNGR